MLRDVNTACSSGLRRGVQGVSRRAAGKSGHVSAPAPLPPGPALRRGLSSRVLASAPFLTSRTNPCLPASVGALPAVHLKPPSVQHKHGAIGRCPTSHGRGE